MIGKTWNLKASIVLDYHQSKINANKLLWEKKSLLRILQCYFERYLTPFVLGGMHDDDYQNRHDAVPNMKLVMNPEGSELSQKT